MYVLGVGGFMHDYNCCLIDVDGGRVAMVEAERLSRRKHHAPRDGDDLMAPVRRAAADLGVKPHDIDTVVFGHTDPFACKDGLRRLLPRAEVIEVDHHLCHAAAAFFASPWPRALIVSVDGFGDGSSALIAVGDGTRITECQRVGEADSIGLEYLRATFHLGLGGYGAEGKTQGLAPYGEPVLFQDYMNEIELTADGGLRLGRRLRSPSSALAAEGGYLNTQVLTNAFLDDACPRRIEPEPLSAAHMNLAASIQSVLEHTVGELVAFWRRRTGETRLVLSGGVAMNSSLNGRLLAEGGFDGIFPLPMASDRGIGLGAALYHVHATLGVPRFFSLETVHYGGAIDDRQALKAMRRAGLVADRVDDIHDVAAAALAEGRIVGWVRGRSEMGARALGNRSILADARLAGMKDAINARVKHREWFRPFAPAVAAERAADYFAFANGAADLDFMTFTVPTRPEGARLLPATTHVDGSARVQTVRGDRQPDFARLIAAFESLTGTAAVLNTSFNDRGEPIVETPDDAVATFLKTDMDLLCVGNVVARRR